MTLIGGERRAAAVPTKKTMPLHSLGGILQRQATRQALQCIVKWPRRGKPRVVAELSNHVQKDPGKKGILGKGGQWRLRLHLGGQVSFFFFLNLIMRDVCYQRIGQS